VADPVSAAGATSCILNGETIRIGPPPGWDPNLVDLVWRSRALHAPGGPLSPDAPVFGDHVLNPDLAPVPGARAPRPAAVLLAFGSDPDGRLALIFTERSRHLSAHAGQVALPGGKIEAGETPAEAALREAEEEVGLPRTALAPLGLVETYVTRSGFSVVPVLALVRREAILRPDPSEVEAAFTVPWADLIGSLAPREGVFERDGVTRRFYETRAAGRRIWGVTAGILKLVNDRLFQR
jgi:8-oxo-dGTP pyrophosphatase MutT (NUDIX family)